MGVTAKHGVFCKAWPIVGKQMETANGRALQEKGKKTSRLGVSLRCTMRQEERGMPRGPCVGQQGGSAGDLARPNSREESLGVASTLEGKKSQQSMVWAGLLHAGRHEAAGQRGAESSQTWACWWAKVWAINGGRKWVNLMVMRLD